jgi:hypothetical protein
VEKYRSETKMEKTLQGGHQALQSILPMNGLQNSDCFIVRNCSHRGRIPRKVQKLSRSNTECAGNVSCSSDKEMR